MFNKIAAVVVLMGVVMISQDILALPTPDGDADAIHHHNPPHGVWHGDTFDNGHGVSGNRYAGYWDGRDFRKLPNIWLGGVATDGRGNGANWQGGIWNGRKTSQGTVFEHGHGRSWSCVDGKCEISKDVHHHDGEHHDGKHHDGEHHDGKHHDGKHHDGKHHDGEHHDGKHHDGEHHDGKHHDGEHHDGKHHDGEHHDGKHHDGEHHDGEHHDGKHHDGKHHDGEHHNDGSLRRRALKMISKALPTLNLDIQETN